jgi:hypothetical protein
VLLYALIRLIIAMAGVVAVVCVFSVIAFAVLVALPVAGIVVAGQWFTKRSTS